MTSPSPFLCLDLGNTTCRGAIWHQGKIYEERVIPTVDFCTGDNEWLQSWNHQGQVAFCSVVPKAKEILLNRVSSISTEIFCLTSESCPGLPIEYPRPCEIGSDRIANSYAVFKRYTLPAIVIDLGTATTFDVITQSGGYVGGVILPGPQGMLDYLSNQTALLPNIKLNQKPSCSQVIGKSTKMAMMNGIEHGYLPMINGIIDSISCELGQNGQVVKSIIETGGEAENFHIDGAIIHHNLTLDGLALACLSQ